MCFRSALHRVAPKWLLFSPYSILFPSLRATASVSPEVMRHQRAELPLSLASLVAARDFFTGCFAESDGSLEHLWVAHLDEWSRCLHLSCHPGDSGGTDFPLKTIIADAALLRSSAIVLAHNHPSGDPTPSAADKRATRRLACAAEALDCRIADHLIFAGGKCASFRAMGLL